MSVKRTNAKLQAPVSKVIWALAPWTPSRRPSASADDHATSLAPLSLTPGVTHAPPIRACPRSPAWEVSAGCSWLVRSVLEPQPISSWVAGLPATLPLGESRGVARARGRVVAGAPPKTPEGAKRSAKRNFGGGPPPDGALARHQAPWPREGPAVP